MYIYNEWAGLRDDCLAASLMGLPSFLAGNRNEFRRGDPMWSPAVDVGFDIVGAATCRPPFDNAINAFVGATVLVACR